MFYNNLDINIIPPTPNNIYMMGDDKILPIPSIPEPIPEPIADTPDPNPVSILSAPSPTPVNNELIPPATVLTGVTTGLIIVSLTVLKPFAMNDIFYM